ncbi:MAG: flagellar biosynthetic protein FliR [Bdellovibrionia bacterium]
MSLFNFNQEELMCFFAVLVRYSVLIAVLPFTGDVQVPAPVKVLLSLAVSIALFPTLLASGQVRPSDAAVWSAEAGSLIGTVALEVIVALILGYTARLAFMAISFGGNLVGNFMGYGIASSYDPNQQSHTQVVAEFHMAIAMLIFLAIDGHHMMLRSALQSYQIVGIGGQWMMGDGRAAMSQRLIQMCSEVLKFGIQLSAPIAIVVFAVNVIFGVMARAVPQLNILVMSVTISAFIGLVVMFLSLGELHGVTINILSRMGDWMDGVLRAMAGK